MERANERLSETEVAEGYSAADLNALSETGFNRPLGDVGVTVDLEEIAMREASAREAARAARTPENRGLSAGEYKNLTDMFNERAEKYRLQTAMDSSVPATPEEIEEAKRKAAVELDEALGSRYDLRAIPDIAPYLPAEEISTTPTGPNDLPVEETTPSQPTLPGTSISQWRAGDTILTFTGEENPSGYVFKDEAGNSYTYSAEELGLTTSQEMPAPDVTSDASQRLGADFDSIMAGESDLYVNPSFGDVPSLNPGEDPPESFTTDGRLFNFVGVQDLQDQAYAVYEDETGKELYVLIQEE
jgi:hypothetical protein